MGFSTKRYGSWRRAALGLALVAALERGVANFTPLEWFMRFKAYED